jgi:hypothetical protein
MGGSIHHHIRLADELPKDVSTLWMAQVQGDATFINVVVPEVQTLFWVGLVAHERAVVAAGIAPGWFDLDYIGPL